MTRDPKTKIDELKEIIRELHQGASVESQKKRFAELLRDVSPAEIAEMEERLIAEGLAEEEIKRLCDVHVQVFKESLDAQLRPESVPGHPLHTLMEENRALEKILGELKELLSRVTPGDGGVSLAQVKAPLKALWDDLAEVEKHYLKKENQLFPFLEAKGVGGPSKVMWAIHDDIRAMLRDFRQQLSEENAAGLLASWRELSATMSDMIYKEEKILFPLSLNTLDEEDWARVKQGEAEVGYAWVEPGQQWKPAPSAGELSPFPAYGRPAGRVELDSGALTQEQINLILKSLPVDITFVDETDTVRYYSAGADRIFPRSPGIIGRKVQNCHPPASVHVVERILEAFREGKREVAEFWIQSKGRFVHIRYFPLRDQEGAYRGCIEVTQDVTSVRGLQGERRLLDWE
jgi:DUF438 domain-containing protein